jgi:CRISPR-associated protein Cas1
MRMHQNTLYIQTQGAYVRRDHETIKVMVEREARLTVPLHHLEGIVCFGRVSISPGVVAVCRDHQLNISFLTPEGKFLARLLPAVSGNVLLRRQQYRHADEAGACLRIARAIVAAKIQNCRNLLLRSARETDSVAQTEELRRAADRLGCALDTLVQAPTLDSVRGCEGDAARNYFAAFNAMIRQQQSGFAISGRSRRPPLDPLNALLSFLYALLAHDMAGALESVGLDPAVGFLHADRPGRWSLALDLLEEFRPLWADRLAISLINLRQIRADGFQTQPGGAVLMDDKTRKTVLAALTQRKREEMQHPLLDEKVTIGLLPHLQARLLARHLRGDIENYPALVLK